MIKAKWFSINNITGIQKACISREYDIIFLGDDYCDRLLLNEESVEEVYSLLCNYNVSLGIKTPVISENNVDKYCTFIDKLGKLHNKIYVTVNDWGLLYYIMEKDFSNLEIIIGRFLTRQKVDRLTSQLEGKIPSIVYSHFCTPTLLNEAFIKYATSKNIHIFELENVPNNVILPKLENEYDIMVSFPYVCTALTRYCPYYQNENDYLKISVCNKECLDEKLSLQAKVHGDYKYISNALVYENDSISKDLNISILVDESERG